MWGWLLVGNVRKFWEAANHTALVARLLGFSLAVLLPAQSHAQFSYEGQPVSSIGIVADPRLDVEKFRALISQLPGKPYSQVDIDASISALKSAGNFTKVIVDPEPEPAGLRVNFILEPAFYIGVVNFTDATKQFSYTRLLQIINFQDEQPFDKSQLPAQETQLLNFFHGNGFFSAQIHSEFALDETHRLANPIFRVNLGKRARIGEIRIQGTTPEETALLLHSIQGFRAHFTRALLKPGKTYTAGRIKSATAALKAYLAKQHYLANRLTFEPPEYHPDTNRADVAISVSLGPKVNITTAGARFSFLPYLSRRQEQKLIPIYGEGSVDRDLVDEGERNIANFFQRKGYFDVKVTTDFKREADKVTIAYNIDKGRRHKVDRLIFTGNHQLSSAELADSIEVRKHRLFSRGLFSEKLLNSSVKDIEGMYRNIGYEDVKVAPHVTDRESNIDVSFNITEGVRTLVDKVDIEGNEHLSIDKLRPPGGFNVLAGTPFSPANSRRIAVTCWQNI